MNDKFQHPKLQILVVVALIALLPSCVAKKKFVEMESYRNKAEQRVKELTKQVSDLQTEFNGYHNDFSYSNSQKDLYIDSLNKVIVGLNSELMSSNENIEDQTFSFQVEKRRLNQLLAEKDREIRMAQRNSDAISVQLEDAKNEVADLKIQLQNAQSSSSANEQRLNARDEEITKLKNDLQTKDSTIKKLQSDLNARNDEIQSLKNQVKLLKEQFGK